VSPKTNSPSPAQRSVQAGAQKANSYQSVGSDFTPYVHSRNSLQNREINALLKPKLSQVVPLRAQGVLSKATLLGA
jgi:hypothetical protein